METKNNLISQFFDGPGKIEVERANDSDGFSIRVRLSTLYVTRAEAESLVALLSAQLQDAERAQASAERERGSVLPQRLAIVDGKTLLTPSVTAGDINTDIASGFIVRVIDDTICENATCRIASARALATGQVEVQTRRGGRFILSADAQIWSV